MAEFTHGLLCRRDRGNPDAKKRAASRGLPRRRLCAKQRARRCSFNDGGTGGARKKMEPPKAGLLLLGGPISLLMTSVSSIAPIGC